MIKIKLSPLSERLWFMKRASLLISALFSSASFAKDCVNWDQAYRTITKYIAEDRGYKSFAPAMGVGLEWNEEDELYQLDFGKNFEGEREYLFVSCSGRVCTTRDECL